MWKAVAILMLSCIEVFWFSGCKYCQLSYSTSTSSTFNDFISGAPSSGWANVIFIDQNDTRLGSTEIFYFPDGREVVALVKIPSLFENLCEEMRCHTASSFDSDDGDPQRYGAFGKSLSTLIGCRSSVNIYSIYTRKKWQFDCLFFCLWLCLARVSEQLRDVYTS